MLVRFWPIWDVPEPTLVEFWVGGTRRQALSFLASQPPAGLPPTPPAGLHPGGYPGEYPVDPLMISALCVHAIWLALKLLSYEGFSPGEKGPQHGPPQMDREMSSSGPKNKTHWFLVNEDLDSSLRMLR